LGAASDMLKPLINHKLSPIDLWEK
jgi:hypothetical protein